MSNKYIIEGKPIPQGRPRVSTRNRKVVVYDPIDSRAYKQKIRSFFNGLSVYPTSSPIRAKIGIFVEIPKSYSKKVRTEINAGKIHPAKKPDLSNYIKLIEDACNGILYQDDAQIVEIVAYKRYSDVPRIEIEVEEI